jgi:hypothetical protein
MYLPKCISLHLRKVQIEGDEVHFDTWITPTCVTVSQKRSTQRSQIICDFERVEVIGAFAKDEPRGTQLFESLLIAQADPAPIVALQQHEGTVKVKPGNGKQIAAALPELSCQIHREISEIAEFTQPLFDEALLSQIELGSVVATQISKNKAQHFFQAGERLGEFLLRNRAQVRGQTHVPHLSHAHSPRQRFTTQTDYAVYQLTNDDPATHETGFSASRAVNAEVSQRRNIAGSASADWIAFGAL